MNITLIEDTRQKVGKHELKNAYFKSQGLNVVREKLEVGDYAIDGNIFVSIDTKQDCGELYSDIITQHDRFSRELSLAQELGIKLYILVENTNGITCLDELGTDKWTNPRWFIYWKTRKGKPPVKNITLMKTAYTLQKKYGCEFIFCRPEEAGEKVLELLGLKGENNGQENSV